MMCARDIVSFPLTFPKRLDLHLENKYLKVTRSKWSGLHAAHKPVLINWVYMIENCHVLSFNL